MGTMGIIGMLEQTDFDTALQWHLEYNHFPPLPLRLMDAAKAAIEAGLEEDWNRKIEMPDGIEHRKYGDWAPAFEVIRFMHLDAFLVPLEDEILEDEEEN